MLKRILALAALLTAAPSRGDDFAVAWSCAKPDAASDFAKAWADALPCGCNGSEPNCPCKPLDADYLAAYKKALAEKKALVVWVGFPCVPCKLALPEAVHIDKPGPLWGVSGPAAIVGVPTPDGKGFTRHDLTGDYSVARVKATIRPEQRLSFTAGSPCGPGGCGVPFNSVPVQR